MTFADYAAIFALIGLVALLNVALAYRDRHAVGIIGAATVMAVAGGIAAASFAIAYAALP